MNQYGHYGLPAIRIAGASVGALLLHLLLPFGLLRYGGPAAPESEWITRGEAMRLRELSEGLVSTNTNPDIVLAGLVIASAGGILLAVLGFQPLQVAAARWIGTVGALLAAIGAGMAWMGSMYHTGTGFAAFLNTVFGGDFRTSFWAFSPVVVAGLSGWTLWEATRVSRQVVSTRDGLRDRIDDAHREGLWAMAFLGAVLLVPWSIGLLPGGVSDALGQDIPGDDTDPFWFSAEDVQSATVAESSWRVRFGADGDFAVLSVSIHAFLTFGWAVFAASWLRAVAGTQASISGATGLLDGLAYTRLPIALLALWAGVMYVLAWILVRPNPDVEHTFLPAFLPALVLWPMLRLMPRIGRDAAALLAPRATVAPE